MRFLIVLHFLLPLCPHWPIFIFGLFFPVMFDCIYILFRYIILFLCLNEFNSQLQSFYHVSSFHTSCFWFHYGLSVFPYGVAYLISIWTILCFRSSSYLILEQQPASVEHFRVTFPFLQNNGGFSLLFCFLVLNTPWSLMSCTLSAFFFPSCPKSSCFIPAAH